MILQLLDQGLTNFSDLLIATITTPKGQQGQIKFKVAKFQRQRENFRIDQAKRQRFYSLIYKLKRDGLVDLDKTATAYQLTQKGIGMISKLKDRLMRKKSYPKEIDSSVNIVTFDIPEKLRGYRNWLRNALRALGFRMLQRSVWIGKIKIPQELLTNLDQYKILDYIEIVSITKSGTIKNID